MPTSPKVTIPLKKTKDLDWEAPLNQYIRMTYGASENFSKESALFNRLRQDIMGAGKDATGRDLLYKYYGQLELLDLRIPVEEGGCKITFTWMDAYSGVETTQHSIAFEKASVLFNLAATNSYIGTEASDLKIAYKDFQAAAGIFAFIADNFLHAPSVDLNRDTVRALSSLMLAQAQQVFVERLIGDGSTKPSMLTKLAKSASVMFKTATDALSTAVSKGWGDRDWVSLSNVQQYYMEAVANHQQALLQASKGKQGLAIAYIKVAISQNNAALKSYLPSNFSSFLEILNGQQQQLNSELATMQKDNDFVYHDTIPLLASLASIGSLDAAKITSMNDLYKDQDIAKLIGRDIFEKLIPVSVAEQSSLYSEEKAKLLRAEGEKVDVAEEELTTALEYLGLPAALKTIKQLSSRSVEEGKVDERVAGWASKVQAHGLISFSDIDQKKRDIFEIVTNASKQLDTEAQETDGLRSRFGLSWPQSASAQLTTTLRSDLHSIKESLWTASNSDAKLQAQYGQSENDIRTLSHGPDSPELVTLFRAGTARSLSGSFEDLNLDKPNTEPPDTTAVENLLKKLTKLKKERGLLFTELKDKVQEDDISSLLILNKKIPNIEEKLFKSELEKFAPYQSRISQTIYLQAVTVKELTGEWRKILDHPLSRKLRIQSTANDDLARRQQVMIERFKKSFQDWHDVYQGKIKGINFYQDLYEFAKSTERNVHDFIENRRDESHRIATSLNRRPL
ncbi:BRO1-like domain-containing protein [Lipomyces japonicus]|uniref:BRO1-like domain-containing protein n=1 Tax=Lipomyces japonicus TaxID=56871 RepID=UPI0034CD556E